MNGASVQHRLSRFFNSESNRSVIVPVDDSLIFGPFEGLDDMPAKLAEIASARPDAILGYPGQLTATAAVARTPWIINITASTSKLLHTRKQQVLDVPAALRAGADGVAVHINVTSTYEQEMMRTLASVASEAHSWGVPVFAIAYPRSETKTGADENYLAIRASDPKAWTEMVAHSARIAVDLGADVVKTHFTGSAESFETVVRAAGGAPVVTSGGPLVAAADALLAAEQAVTGGAAGVSFGRNVFSRPNSASFLRAIRGVVHNDRTAAEATAEYENLDSILKVP